MRPRAGGAPQHRLPPATGNTRTRTITASVFLSLDGISRASGTPEEEPTGGVALGGWTGPCRNEAMGTVADAAGFASLDCELRLGRRTAELFATHWQYPPGDDPLARTINGARRSVASRTRTALSSRLPTPTRAAQYRSSACPTDSRVSPAAVTGCGCSNAKPRWEPVPIAIPP